MHYRIDTCKGEVDNFLFVQRWVVSKGKIGKSKKFTPKSSIPFTYSYR
jgi:hypothetical protein